MQDINEKLQYAFKIYFEGYESDADKIFLEISNAAPKGYYDHLIGAELVHFNIPRGFFWCKRAIEKQCYLGIKELAQCYYQGLGCPKDWRKGAQIFIDTNSQDIIKYRIFVFKPLEEEMDDYLMELYVYASLDLYTPNKSHLVKYQSDTNTRSALLTWLWISKIHLHLPKDIRRLIGEKIWASRIFPNCWRVKINV